MISAVYCFRNLVNGKRYVGSSVDVEGRRKSHISMLRRGKHHSVKFQHAWDKYGRGQFIFETLSACSEERLRSRD